MDYVEAEGQSIDDAIERALKELGVERDRVEIEIVENATRGLFGIGSRKARVRATLRTPLNLETEIAEAPAPRAESRPAGKPAPERTGPVAAAATPGTVQAPAAERGGHVSKSAARDEAPPTTTDSPASRAPKASPKAVNGAVLDQARKTLEEVVRLIGSEGHVEIVQDEDGPRLLIDGDTSGVLIGRRGQTLDALEYFINRTISRDEEGPVHLVVDSQDYRARRRAALVDLARRLGERARRRGKTVTLNPMTPRDRRIVHLALQDDPSLTTRSSGKGYFRKLLIIPNGEGRGGGRTRAS